ncbi:putative luxR family transcriptional regulator [Photobacterium gaetbulicola Gung47]|uniref:Putative luxR family transcriptional regulator n=2 Tax=Photobacterium gaetbulicola TaxID=1295392 RepID=A0A0C5W4D6_9GAMM|nr:putative luxR family transcriptional regulator [Photobacterium gaetbulicola Gung47]
MFNTGFIFSLYSSFNDPSMYQEQGSKLDEVKGLCDCFTPLQETYAYFIMCGFSNDVISTILNKSIKTVENNMSRLFDKAQMCYSPYIISRREFRNYLLKNKITNLSPAGTMKPFIKTLTTVPSNSIETGGSSLSHFLRLDDFEQRI